MQSPVILITGAGKGIGKALALEIASRKNQSYSPKLLLISRTESDLSSLQNQIMKKGLDCEILVCDLAEQPNQVMEWAKSRFGRLDQLIHSAGVGRFGNFLELTPSDLNDTIKTNIEGTFLLLQAAYQQMLNQSILNPKHKGDVVCISSLAAEKPFEQSAIYCMSKFAQRGLLEVMKLYGHRDCIRIMEVMPGATLTPMWGNSAQAERMMEAGDIAKIILDALALPARASVESILIRPIQGDI